MIPISRLTDDTQIYEYACHEGNYAMPNLLRGGRTDAARTIIEVRDPCARHLVMLFAGAGTAVAHDASVGASRICGRVRRDQADQVAGHGREDGMDQPAHLDPPRREEAERHGRALDDRRRPAERAVSAGIHAESLPEGAEIVVEGFRAKDGSLKGNGRDLTFADGRRLFVGSSGTGAPEK